VPITPRRVSPEEQLREAVNNAAVGLVAAGFSAIDELAEMGKNRLKRAIIRGMSAPRKDRQ
jgi:hypothetical protein